MIATDENGNGARVRTLIVDDAPIMRKAIKEILSKDDHIDVLGVAVHGQDCLDKIPSFKPDVVTMDIDMPVMNGITAVKNIMVRYQIPVLIISSLVQDGWFAFEALRLGVMDFVPKPSKANGSDRITEEELIRMRVRAAARMQVHRMRRVRRRKRPDVHPTFLNSAPSAVAILGATLAGPNTVMRIVTHLPPDFAGSVIALQEIHPRILGPFCSYFNEISPLEVVAVTGPQKLCSGKVYVGTTRCGMRITTDSHDGEPVIDAGNSAEGAIDSLLESATEHFGENACGVLLSGLGTDGARGMLTIRERGGLTIGQDHECSVYPNIVEHAMRENVLDLLMSQEGIAARLESWAAGRVNAR